MSFRRFSLRMLFQGRSLAFLLLSVITKTGLDIHRYIFSVWFGLLRRCWASQRKGTA
jgi:hypothetical protein